MSLISVASETHRQKNRGALAPLTAFACLAALMVFTLAGAESASALGQRDSRYTAGFRTMPLWDEHKNIYLEIGIWYPSQREESLLNLQDWSLSVAQNAKEAPGAFPLVLISHDAGGGMLSYSDTAANLARNGFVVMAPTHSLDNFADSSGIFKPTQILERPKELAFVLAATAGTNSLRFVDYDRLAVLGVGSGAATALSLAGGLPDFKAYLNYCADIGIGEPYCSDLAQKRMREGEHLPPASFDFPKPHISALILAAPACGMFFTREGLAAVKQPMLVFTPKTDSINNAALHGELIKRNLPLPPATIVLNGDSTNLLAPCGENVIELNGLNCREADEDALAQRQKEFNTPLLAFLKNILGEPTHLPPRPVH